MTEKITIEGLIRNSMEARLLDVHTSIAGIVESVNSDGTVDISVAIKRVGKDGEDFNVPVLPDVPVLFMGTGSLSIAFSLSKGDEGLIIFSERDISGFIDSGKILKPVQLRKHEYSDAVFIPASLSNGKRSSIPSSGFEITGDVKIIGKLDVTDEVVARSDSASVTLSGHTHIDSQGGPTQPPTSGT